MNDFDLIKTKDLLKVIVYNNVIEEDIEKYLLQIDNIKDEETFNLFKSKKTNDDVLKDILNSFYKKYDNHIPLNTLDVLNSLDILKSNNIIVNIKDSKNNNDEISNNNSFIFTDEHEKFNYLLNLIKLNLYIYIVGPSGSGKTYACEKIAEKLNLNYYYTGAVMSEFKLTGFIDINGNVVRTPFREAYENGGLFLFDEIDGSDAQALLTFNSALANDKMDFPDKIIHKHPDFKCVAAANTIGTGADRIYVGRNQLDGATLDRFVMLEWNYDENLEISLAKNKEWCYKVQTYRAIVNEMKLRHIISTRAIIYGDKLLEGGFNSDDVEKLVVWKGLDKTQIDKIKIKYKEYNGKHYKKF